MTATSLPRRLAALERASGKTTRPFLVILGDGETVEDALSRHPAQGQSSSASARRQALRSGCSDGRQ